MHNIASGLSRLLKSFDLSYLYEWIYLGEPQFEFERKMKRFKLNDLFEEKKILVIIGDFHLHKPIYLLAIGNAY